MGPLSISQPFSEEIPDNQLKEKLRRSTEATLA